jgi:hypothetical protein
VLALGTAVKVKWGRKTYDGTIVDVFENGYYDVDIPEDNSITRLNNCNVRAAVQGPQTSLVSSASSSSLLTNVALLIEDASKKELVPFLLMKNFAPSVALLKGVAVLGWSKLEADKGKEGKSLAIAELEKLRCAANEKLSLNLTTDQKLLDYIMEDPQLADLRFCGNLKEGRIVETDFLAQTRLGQIMAAANNVSRPGSMNWRKLFPFIALAQKEQEQRQYIFTKI